MTATGYSFAYLWYSTLPKTKKNDLARSRCRNIRSLESVTRYSVSTVSCRTVLRPYLWGERVDDVEKPVLRELVDRILLTILCTATCHCQLVQS
jgi:hypothetical protein